MSDRIPDDLRPPWSLPRRLRPLQEFLATEASGAVMVLAGALLALLWANLSPTSYDQFWGTQLPLELGGTVVLDLSLRHWVNDVAMTLFFFVVGLEIKRELTSGELRDRRAVALPVLAAIGGMLVPALVYLALNAGGATQGWGVPMATDIAFALAVLTIAGRGLPARLRVFLLTLAIVDDVGAIVVIALFYSAGVDPLWLGAALLGVGAMVGLQRLHVQQTLVYALLGIAVWYATYRAGIHPTIAGVVVALAVPSPARLEHRLHPWSSSLVVPVFALANAGVVLRPAELSAAIASPVFLGVLLGLVVGKIVGVAGATWLASRLGLGEPPGGGRAVLGVATVAGIGFTVSLFVAELAFPDAGEAGAAKLGILAASVLAGGAGAMLLRSARRAGA